MVETIPAARIAPTGPLTDDYKSDEKPTWCPGCGDFGVLNAVYRALRTKGYAPHEVVAVSGIGCSSRLPYFMSTYGFHGIHGRAMPIATGIRVARPELKVLVFGGDGDAFAIGAGHFVHAMRRNLDICYVVMDNAVYGLTKGQSSPTAATGYTNSSGMVNPEQPVNPLLLALGSGATFVARGFSAEPQKLAHLIVRGIDHTGFAFIDVYSPCPTFNKVNTFKYYKEEVAELPREHDAGDLGAAMRYAAMDDPLHLGVFYQREGRSFEQRLAAQRPEQLSERRELLERLFQRLR